MSADGRLAGPDEALSPGAGTRALSLLVAGTGFMQNLDGTVVTPAIPPMAAQFGVPNVDMTIGISAYMIAVGVFIPISGWLTRRFSPRRVFLAAIVIFTLASLVCGLSQSLPAFVAARVVQGIGGALMLPVGRLLVLRDTPKDQLVHAMAILVWPSLIAPVLGPPLGGLIVDWADWRWLFWLNLPLGVLALGVAMAIVPHGGVEPVPRFDFRGFFLCGIGIFAVLFGAEYCGQIGVSALGIGLLAIGGAALVAGVSHLRRAPAPLIGLGAMGKESFRVTVASGAFFRLGTNSITFLVPVMMMSAFGWSGFEAGLLLMAVFAGNLLIKTVTTPTLRRFGFKPVLVSMGLANALLIGALAFARPGVPVWLLAVVLFLSGVARSMQFTSYSTMAFADIDKPEMPDANSLFAVGVQLSMGLGIAVGGIVWRMSQLGVGAGIEAFHVTFAVMGLITALSLIGAVRMPAGIADHVARGRK